MREWTDDLWKILIAAVPAIWEANGRSVSGLRGGSKIPSTTMFISANLTVAEVEKKLSSALRSKIALIYTGDKSLQHENKSELCSELIDAAKELYKYLPSIAGLGKYISVN